MNPKLRPSFPDILKHLDEILACVKVEEIEHGDAKLSGDDDKKTIPKGKRHSNEMGCGNSAFHLLNNINNIRSFLLKDTFMLLLTKVNGRETICFMSFWAPKPSFHKCFPPVQ